MKRSLYSKKWLILLAFALGSVIAVAVSYLAITSYLDRNAVPSYFAEMAGGYCTENVRDPSGNMLKGADCAYGIGLEENGRFYTSVNFFQDSDWAVRGGQNGTWSVSGNTLILEAGYSGLCKLQIIGNSLYDPRYDRYFRKI